VEEGFKHLGLRLAKSSENLSFDGYDRLLIDKAFHLRTLILYAIEDEIVAHKIRDGESVYSTDLQGGRRRKL